MLIRSESHAIKATPEDRALLRDTVDEYRRLVRALCGIFFVHFEELSQAKSKCFTAERLFHSTQDNPDPRYRMVDRMFPKFPSYYRRAAIEAAYGVVSSYLSNYDRWVTGLRKTAHAKPPMLGLSAVYPPLYGGQCIRIGTDWKHVEIKVFDATRKMWHWTPPLAITGRLKRMNAGKALSPSLIVTGSNVALGCPVEMATPKSLNIGKKERDTLKPKAPSEPGRPFSLSDLFGLFNNKPVCSIDVGINTTATGTIVNASGTVIARRFFTGGRHNDQRDKLSVQIRGKAAQTCLRNTPSKNGFCTDLYRRIAGINKQSARMISSQIVAFASEFGAATLVFEHLKGWRPKAPKKSMRIRFHRFLHRAIVRCAEHKTKELGMRLAFIAPRGTSAWAYDGSGLVKRDAKNYSLCTFATGKRYNADLNAANNIAARYIMRTLSDVGLAPSNGPAADSGKSPRSAPGMPVCLSNVWEFAASLS